MKRWMIWVLVLVVLFFVGLFVVPFPAHSQVASLTRTWTSPGDDGNVGTATSYEMRWSATKPDTTSDAGYVSWWNAATVVPNLPTPLVAGTTQSVAVAPAGGFLTGRTYYFVIRARDDAGNVSGWSNVAWQYLPDTVAPAPILDLR